MLCLLYFILCIHRIEKIKKKRSVHDNYIARTEKHRGNRGEKKYQSLEYKSTEVSQASYSGNVTFTISEREVGTFLPT